MGDFLAEVGLSLGLKDRVGFNQLDGKQEGKFLNSVRKCEEL